MSRDIGSSDDEAHELPTEFLDDTSDTHAAWFGLLDGLAGVTPKPTRKESMKEPHYYQLGYFGAYVLKIGLMAGLGVEFGIPEALANVAK